MFHLGDICDSFYLEESAECIRLLQDYQVLAVKGNNDHVITRYHDSHDRLTLTLPQRNWLNQLPLVRYFRGGIFTHSLPFEHELGLSCMVRPLETTQAEQFFSQFPRSILFRGHSHVSEIISSSSPSTRTPLPFNQAVDLLQSGYSIITCGALLENICAIWQPDEHLLTSLHFECDDS